MKPAIRCALADTATSLSWEDVRTPWWPTRKTVAGVWNGRAAAFCYVAPSRYGFPAFLHTELATDSPGRFEIKGHSDEGDLLAGGVRFLGPQEVPLFDPGDAARFHAYGDDRTIVDQMLALPGMRDALALLLSTPASTFHLTNKIFRAGLRVGALDPGAPLRASFGIHPPVEQVRDSALEEWAVLQIAAQLGH